MLRTLAALLACLLLPAAAQAADYCVGAPAGCPAGGIVPVPDTLPQALVSAKASAAVADDIYLGAGEFETGSGFVYEQGGEVFNDVRIIGAGQEQTILKATGPQGSDFNVLALHGESALETGVEDLTVELPERSGGGGATGILLTKARAEDVAVRNATGAIEGGAVGILMGTSARLARAAVSLVPDLGTVGVQPAAAGTVIEDLLVTNADWGVYAGLSGSGSLSRGRITAERAPVACQGCDGFDVHSVLLLPGSAGSGLLSAAGGAEAATLRASHVTIVGPAGADTTIGAQARVGGDGTMNATLEFDNSIITGVDRAIQHGVVSGTGVANVTTHSSNYDAATNQSSGGTLQETAITNLPVAFVDAAGGDYHLEPDAEQIDAGRLTPFVASTTDFDGESRALDGDRDGTAQPDQGADEYQALTPVAAITGAESVEEDSPLVLSGAASTDGGDPGDEIVSYVWDFGDGSVGNGASVAHIYASPGSYAVKLTVTDVGGLSASSIRTVTVSARPAPPAPPAPAPTATPAPITTPRPLADRTPPTVVAMLRAPSFRRSRGTALRVGISEAARVRILFTRKGRTVKRSTRSLRAGTTTINLRSLTRRLRPASYTILVTATDRAGNVSRRVPLKARIRR